MCELPNSVELKPIYLQELELERKRYNESAEALARNQEDLRKREVKITSLEKENESMKKKIADLEEDLRVRIPVGFICGVQGCVVGPPLFCLFLGFVSIPPSIYS